MGKSMCARFEYVTTGHYCRHCGAVGLDRLIQPQVSHREAEVVFRCGYCGSITARYYRDPVMERYPARADPDLIERNVSARRIIAWVGYARNYRTLPLSEEAIHQRAVILLARKLAEANKVERTDRGDIYLPGESCPSSADKTTAENLLLVCGVVADAIRRQAEYELRHEMMYGATMLPIRGFWFEDRKIAGTITRIVRCLTGVRRSGNYYAGDWDPPYLGVAVHHSLYVLDDAFLVHPLDIEHASN